MKKIILVIAVLSFSLLRVHAQNVKIEGHIKDKKSEIPYVTVSLFGQKVKQIAEVIIPCTSKAAFHSH